MQRARPQLAVWSLAALLLAVLVGASWRPVSVGWRCWALHARGEHAQAVVAEKAEGSYLVLRIADGPAAGRGCVARTSQAHHAALEIGDVLPVVALPGAEADCELEATVRNSLALMAVLTALLGLVALAILGTAAWLSRTMARPVAPTTRLEAGARPACPRCDKPMEEGSVVLLAGVHWRRPGQAMGLPHALAGLPGTVGWRGRPCLHAYRCEPCGVVTFRHGGVEGQSAAAARAERP